MLAASSWNKYFVKGELEVNKKSVTVLSRDTQWSTNCHSCAAGKTIYKWNVPYVSRTVKRAAAYPWDLEVCSVYVDAVHREE